MCSGDTQVCRPREETATASSPPPGSPGAALSGCSVCARMELQGERGEKTGGETRISGKAQLSGRLHGSQLCEPPALAHPHLRKGMSGTGYLEGSCRNSSGMPPATLARGSCPPWPGALPPPAPLALAPPHRPGVAAPLGAALPSRLVGRREAPPGPTRRRD